VSYSVSGRQTFTYKLIIQWYLVVASRASMPITLERMVFNDTHSMTGEVWWVKKFRPK